MIQVLAFIVGVVVLILAWSSFHLRGVRRSWYITRSGESNYVVAKMLRKKEYFCARFESGTYCWTADEQNENVLMWRDPQSALDWARENVKKDEDL